MAKFCTNCGAQIQEEAGFCNQCGAPASAPAAQPAYQQPTQGQAAYQQVPPQPMNPQGGSYYPPNGYPNPAYGGQPLVVVKPKVPGKGFGISAMVLGIIGIVYAFILMMGIIALVAEYKEGPDSLWSQAQHEEYYEDMFDAMIPGVIVYAVMPLLGIIFGVCSRARGYRNGVSASGIVLGAIGMVCCIVALILLLTV